MFRIVFLFVLACPLLARANPPIEDLSALVLHPTDPAIMALKVGPTGDSLLVTDDGGATWNLICQASIYVDNQAVTALGMSADGRLQIGTFGTLYQDDATRCAWATEPMLQDRWAVDFTAHPGDSEVLFTVTSDGGGKLNGILRRSADGTWTKVGVEEPLRISRLRVTTVGAALRFYESAAKDVTLEDGGPGTEYVIRVSDDEGASWREHPFTTDGSLRLVAVDPSNPDRIVALVSRLPGTTVEAGMDELLVSSDQGATFIPYLSITEFTGLTFGKDGRVFIADRGDTMFQDAPMGLWSAPNLDTAPASLASDYPVLCLEYQPANDTLYGCQRWWFGTIDPESGVFTTSSRVHETPAMLSCEGRDLVQVCELQLCRKFCKVGHFAIAPACGVYDTPFCGPCAEDAGAKTCRRPAQDAAPEPADAMSPRDAADGGPRDAGPSSGAPSGDSGCSCTTAGRPRRARATLTIAALALGLLHGRRRR